MEFYGVEGSYAYIECYRTSYGIDYSLLKQLARENRRNSTLAENVMWDLLRAEFKDVKFRRQHIIGDYIVDFVCFRFNLIIEIDGGYHDDEDQKKQDVIRTEWLNRQGLQVIRFTNEEVMFQPEMVVSRLKEILLTEQTDI